MVMFTIHDYPAYGTLAGLVTKGYKGCVCCGPHNICRRSSSLKKMVWDHQHRRYLPRLHWMREEESLFRGVREDRSPPQRMTGREFQIAGEERKQWLQGEGHTAGGDGDLVLMHGVKKPSAFYQLPYWKDLLIRHTLEGAHSKLGESLVVRWIYWLKFGEEQFERKWWKNDV